MKRFALVFRYLLCAVLLLGLVAVPVAADAAEATYRDELNIAVMSSPPTLDTASSSSQLVWDIGQTIFEPLYTQDINFEVSPMLAESYTMSDDMLTYTFVIRQGVLFHNGEEMKAEDVAASMAHWMTTSPRAAGLFGAGVWEATGDYEVKVTLEKPASDLLIVMSSQSNFASIMPKAIVESISETSPLSEYIGTGPFVFESWDPDQNLVLSRFADYKPREEAASGFAGRREALVDRVTYHFISDPATRIAGLLSGQFDIADGLPKENYQEIKALDGYKVLSDMGGTTTLYYNVQQGPLADHKLREAIQTGLNFEEIMLGAYIDEDLYELDPGYMNPNSLQWNSKAGADRYNIADPEKAKQLLDEAGYNGETIRILTTPNYKDMYDSCMFISGQLDALGMKTEILEFDFPTFMENRTDLSKWDLFVTTNAYQQTPPQLLPLNKSWAGADDPKIGELSSAIRQAKTPEEAREIWDELQAFLYDYLSSSVIGQYKDLIAISDLVEAEGGYAFWQAPLVWNVRVREP